MSKESGIQEPPMKELLSNHTEERPCVSVACSSKHCLNNDLSRETEQKAMTCKAHTKNFSRAVHLKSHADSHSLEKLHVWDMCVKRLSLKSNLNKHPTRTARRSFVCQVCSKGFLQKKSLDKHFCTQTEEKSFVCDVCSASFFTKWDFNTHYRIHTGEKPFVCEVCSKKFSYKGNLKVHYRQHTGEKPFSCDVCFKRFIQRSHLKSHIKSHAK